MDLKSDQQPQSVGSPSTWEKSGEATAQQPALYGWNYHADQPHSQTMSFLLWWRKVI